ncbi:MAG: aldo/keto reductase [Lentisphaerae bacterium]|nr:aldo/keto reductase [Lentisphaerota bacterium]
MKFSSLPGTQQQASTIVLGCAWFGTDIPESRAFELMDTFAGQGGNFLDTAHMYAGWVPGGAGKSETTIGRWLKTVRRADVVVGTKGADQGMNEASIRRQLAESLTRLATDYVDFYWLHSDDPQTPAGEILGWLNRMADEGLFRSFGCSNWRLPRLREAAQYAKDHRLRGFAASQIGWSLARVTPEVAKAGSQVFMDDDTFAFHRNTGMPVVAFSSQAGGFFAGKYNPEGAPEGQKPNPAIVRYYGTPENHARLAAVRKFAGTRGRTANQVALAYLINQPFPAFAIVGAGTRDYVLDACGAADLVLTAGDLAALDIRR